MFDTNTILLYLGVFLLVFLLTPLWVRPLGVIRFVIHFALITWVYLAGNLDKCPELPTTVFWILFALFLPTLLLPFCCGNIFLYFLILTNLPSLKAFPWATFMSPCFWLMFAIVYPAALAWCRIIQPPTLIFWFPITVLLHDQIHFQMKIGYWVTWPLILFFLDVYPHHQKPISWFVVCATVITGCVLLIHPGETWIRFLLFALSIHALMLVHALYPWIYMYPERYLFPFNLISNRYRLNSRNWYPITQRTDSHTTLCEQCQRLTTDSKLIMGSYLPIISLVEWHDMSSGPPFRVSSGGSLCQLCHLLWHSVSASVEPQDPHVCWRVKIWEERPLSRFTFVKLYHGTRPVGTRLLVHKGEIFGEQSPATLSRSTGSDRIVVQAKSWLRSCQAHHKLCNSPGTSPRKLPRRLCHVTPALPGEPRNTNPVVKLLDVGPSDRTIQYLAFSHTWGGTSTLRLQKANYGSCQHEIDFSGLSPNVQDALRITRDLGFSYIWIDSLCIIQDSTEDWEVEAAKMGDVFASAVCTIASTGSSNGDGGCFHPRNPLSLIPCQIAVSSLDELQPERLYIRRDDLSGIRRGVDGAPLNRRGWVTQERLLSHRILHYGAEMLYWECCQRTASELNPTGFVFKKYPEEFYGNFIPPPAQVDPIEPEMKPWSRTELIRRRTPTPDLDLSGNAKSPRSGGFWQGNRGFWKETRRYSHLPWKHDDYESRFRSPLDRIENTRYLTGEARMLRTTHLWFEMVESYTRTRLTFPSDRLIAINGIMQRIERATHSRFVAGLLTEHLVANLLWFTSEGPGTRMRNKHTPRLISRAVSEQPSIDSLSQDELEDTPGLITTTIAGLHHAPTFIAPTWSWASVDGVVTVDVLPDNANRTVSVTRLASADVKDGPDTLGKFINTSKSILELKGPLSQIRKVERINDEWLISVNSFWGRRVAKFFPDLSSFAGHIDESGEVEMFCLSCMIFQKENEHTILRSHKVELQGLVLQRLVKRNDDGSSEPDIFERIGFFTTGQLRFLVRKILSEAPEKMVQVI